MNIKKLLPFIVFFVISIIFFRPFILHQKLPLPADTIIGLYHPFRDLYRQEYPNGIPFKNFLITDPVRQGYPWRLLTISIEKKGELPLWNPFSFSGTPLAANLQSAPFYPINLIFFVLPFSFGWTFLIFLEPLLMGIFLYFFMRNLKVSAWGSTFSGVAFAFCGFSVSWLEWGNILHVALWFPLILLAIDKSIAFFSADRKRFYLWLSIYIAAYVMAFLGGHLQTFFYIFVVATSYFFLSLSSQKNKVAICIPFLFAGLTVAAITAIQWYPTFQFISLSARNMDQNVWQKEGWYLPWQHLIQFLAPDFFGNPSTLNYSGVWNYGELTGYIGVVSLLFSLHAVLIHRTKKTLFFFVVCVSAFLLALPTFLAKLPFTLQIPFLSSAQPTRLLFVIDFCLAVLAGFGFDVFSKKKYPIGASICIIIVFLILWVILLFPLSGLVIPGLTLSVAKKNMILPTVITAVSLISIGSFIVFAKQTTMKTIILLLLLGLQTFDGIRFAEKFDPFTDSNYLFPSTKTISFLQKNLGNHRMMSLDPRILPPNFPIMYQLQSIEGYDPLYLKRYGELIASVRSNIPQVDKNLGFNRIITLEQTDSPVIDLLGVKYILSLSEVSSSKLVKVFEEGETKIYENKDVLPRTFFVERTRSYKRNERVPMLQAMLQKNMSLEKVALVEDDSIIPNALSKGSATITSYTANRVVITTTNEGTGFLVLTDSYHPMWEATIDGTITMIYLTDYSFRGIIVPKGNHTIVFSPKLF